MPDIDLATIRQAVLHLCDDVARLVDVQRNQEERLRAVETWVENLAARLREGDHAHE